MVEAVAQAATRRRLSIIVATYQCARCLQRCLDSIARQTFRDWELLVVDGGSSDGTVDIIRANADRIAYWHSQPDNGIYDAWNQALAHATGEYVAFLGADDAWHDPGVLQAVFDAIGDREYDLVTGSGRMVDVDGRHIHTSSRAWDYDKLRRRMTISHPGTLHRRALFERHGLFDTRYRIVADYEFLLRLPRELRTLHLPLVLADIEEGGISRNRWWRMLRERYRVQAACPRIGKARAMLNFVDKLWRIPVGKALGIPH